MYRVRVRVRCMYSSHSFAGSHSRCHYTNLVNFGGEVHSNACINKSANSIEEATKELALTQ